MKKVKNQYLKTKMRFIGVPVIITLLICSAIVVALKFVAKEREPLTPREILEKKEWSKGELVDTIARAGMQTHHDGAKVPEEVLKHLQEQMRKMPESDRQEVAVEVVRKSIIKGRDIWRNMTPEARKNTLNQMKEDAIKNREAAESMSKEEKREGRAELKEAFDSFNKGAADSLTPDERKEIAPIAKEWIRTMECLQ